MLTISSLTGLFDYNYWARDRQLEACALLTPEQLVQPLGGSFASLRDTLAHMLGVEWLWLERWRGAAPSALLPAAEFPTLAALTERWRAVETEMRQYVAGLTDEALGRVMTYQNIRGISCAYPLGSMLYHLLNHQSYHRGQVTMSLRQLGATPLGVDYLMAVDAGLGSAK
ncbi:MAG TPA: DinB family protein [Bryobacteraceae bacterium]|nr:DinB family protein [Bryobacteraceae bacterium]